jgi:hypothetical protein
VIVGVFEFDNVFDIEIESEKEMFGVGVMEGVVEILIYGVGEGEWERDRVIEK